MGKLRDYKLSRESELKGLINELFQDVGLHGLDLKVNAIFRDVGVYKEKYNFYFCDYDYLDQPTLKLKLAEISSEIYATSLIAFLISDVYDVSFDNGLFEVIKHLFNINNLSALANELDITRQYIEKNIKLAYYQDAFKKRLISHFNLREDFFTIPNFNGLDLYIAERKNNKA